MAKAGFHGVVGDDKDFPAEQGRYHLYIGYSCPFAHRVNLMRYLKGLTEIIDVSIGRLRSKDDGIPEWVFTTDGDDILRATRDKLYGCARIREVYQRLDPEYQGKFTIPLLIDRKQDRIVNNESAEMMRCLSTAFNDILPAELASVTMYPKHLRNRIDLLFPPIQGQLATGVYKAGFNPNQTSYEENLAIVFAMLNRLEVMLHESDGPYMLGNELTELDLILDP